MIRAYLYALDPTEAQEQAFRSHRGGQRAAFNFGLTLIRANLDQRAAERSYGIAEDDLTPAVSWSGWPTSPPPCRTGRRPGRVSGSDARSRSRGSRAAAPA